MQSSRAVAGERRFDPILDTSGKSPARFHHRKAVKATAGNGGCFSVAPGETPLSMIGRCMVTASCVDAILFHVGAVED